MEVNEMDGQENENPAMQVHGGQPTVNEGKEEQFGPVNGIIVGDKRICIGQEIRVAGSSCRFISTKIVGYIHNGHITCEVSGPLIDNEGGLCPAALISCKLPSTTVDVCSKVDLSKSGQKQLSGMLSAAAENCVQVLKNASWKERYYIRMQQFAVLLHEEIKLGLKRPGAVKHINMGPAQLDIDRLLYGMKPATNSSSFSYRLKSISNLDKFLGEKWDIHVLPEAFYRFVSELVIKVDLQGICKATVKLAKGEGVLPQDYRSAIQARITSRPN
jgi:hypothetical protein